MLEPCRLSMPRACAQAARRRRVAAHAAAALLEASLRDGANLASHGRQPAERHVERPQHPRRRRRHRTARRRSPSSSPFTRNSRSHRRHRRQGARQVRDDRIDLAIMDVGLPDMDGREAVKLMRRNGFRSPIIMLTGQDTESDTVLGLEVGRQRLCGQALPFAVLLARIRAQLRQHEASEDAVFTIGPYTFRPGAKLLVSAKGSKLKLTEKETAILRFLYRAGQKVGDARRAAARGLGLQRRTSRRTRWKRTSTACGRRSSAIPPTRRSSSPRPAATSWCRDGAALRRWPLRDGHRRSRERAAVPPARPRRPAADRVRGAKRASAQPGELLFSAARPPTGGYV